MIYLYTFSWFPTWFNLLKSVQNKSDQNHIEFFILSNRHISSSTLIEHRFKKIQLSQSNHNDDDQLSHCEVLDGVFVTNNDLWVYYLPLLFELLVFWNFLEVLTDFNQLCVEFVDLWLFGKFHQVGLVMCVEVKRDWLVLPIGRCKADIVLVIAADVCLVRCSTHGLSFARVMWNDLHWNLLRGLTCDFVWELYGFAWLLLQLKTERSCWNAEVNRWNLIEQNCQ